MQKLSEKNHTKTIWSKMAIKESKNIVCYNTHLNHVPLCVFFQMLLLFSVVCFSFSVFAREKMKKLNKKKYV